MNDNPETPRQDVLRDARKQITRALFLALVALGVIVFACYAWFTNNTKVSGSNIAVSTSGSRFELASVGDINGIFDAQLPDAHPEEDSVWGKYDGGRITNSDRTILWRVSQDSNLGNHTGGIGIEPGKNGTLQFYVVPKGVNSLRLTFSLEIIPLVNQDNNKFVETADPIAKNFLKGHVLVRQQESGTDASTLIDPKSGTFSLTVEADPVLVNLKWSWPYLLEDAIKGNTGIERIINASPYCFLCDDHGVPVTTPFTLPDQNEPEFRKYSNYYNNADQYIGTNVDAILFRLTATEG